MKIALAQMKVIPGNPEVNVRIMKGFIEKAVLKGCQVIAFPEMCVGGYLLGDRWTEDSWCRELMTYNEVLKTYSQNIVLIYGNVYADEAHKNKDGRLLKFNAAYAFYNQKPLRASKSFPLGITVKTLLPNYRIFDDERYFFSLQEYALSSGIAVEELIMPFEISMDGKIRKLGVEICEDLWFNDYLYKGKPLNVSRYLIEKGAEVLINISSSPWTYGKDRARDNRINDIRKDSDSFVPFYYVNCVGTQNNGKNMVVFDGDSTVYNEKGEVVATAEKPYEEELLVYEKGVNAKCFIKRPPEKIEAKYSAVLQGIRGVDELMGRSNFPYIIGLSGGVDSSLVAVLLSLAVGPERVIACNLPTKYNSDATKAIAAHLAQKLGIRYHTLPIEKIVELNESILKDFNPSLLNCENIQAKIRGTSILSNIAGITNGVMTCNGNKIEIALGYATLYGDVNGAIAPIGDLLKTEIFEMCRFMNQSVFKETVIPESLIPDELFNFKVPPTAELKNNQIDPMKWGYHDALVHEIMSYRRLTPESVLEAYLEEKIPEILHIDSRLMERYALNNPKIFIEDLEWVFVSMQKAVFKRIQSPPVIILSKSSFGYDYRESQLPVFFSNHYTKLKQEILEKVQ